VDRGSQRHRAGVEDGAVGVVAGAVLDGEELGAGGAVDEAGEVISPPSTAARSSATVRTSVYDSWTARTTCSASRPATSPGAVMRRAPAAAKSGLWRSSPYVAPRRHVSATTAQSRMSPSWMRATTVSPRPSKKAP
jgi:hypothetical protein